MNDHIVPMIGLAVFALLALQGGEAQEVHLRCFGCTRYQVRQKQSGAVCLLLMFFFLIFQITPKLIQKDALNKSFIITN